MKMRLSYKDVVLLIGILVAVVIVFTTWTYSDLHPRTSIVQPIIRKEKLNSATSMVIGKLTKKAQPSADCVG